MAKFVDKTAKFIAFISLPQFQNYFYNSQKISLNNTILVRYSYKKFPNKVKRQKENIHSLSAVSL